MIIDDPIIVEDMLDRYWNPHWRLSYPRYVTPVHCLCEKGPPNPKDWRAATQDCERAWETSIAKAKASGDKDHTEMGLQALELETYVEDLKEQARYAGYTAECAKLLQEEGGSPQKPMFLSQIKEQEQSFSLVESPPFSPEDVAMRKKCLRNPYPATANTQFSEKEKAVAMYYNWFCPAVDGSPGLGAWAVELTEADRRKRDGYFHAPDILEDTEDEEK